MSMSVNLLELRWHRPFRVGQRPPLGIFFVDLLKFEVTSWPETGMNGKFKANWGKKFTTTSIDRAVANLGRF